MPSPDIIPIESLAKRRVGERDEKYLSPSERATLVNTLLFHSLGLDSPSDAITNPLYWDLICYCMEMLSLYFVQLGDERALVSLKLLNNIIYSYHYSVPDGTAILGPDRAEHEAIWKGRLER